MNCVTEESHYIEAGNIETTPKVLQLATAHWLHAFEGSKSLYWTEKHFNDEKKSTSKIMRIAWKEEEKKPLELLTCDHVNFKRLPNGVEIIANIANTKKYFKLNLDTDKLEEINYEEGKVAELPTSKSKELFT
jgi:hypothetical protein